MRKRLRIILCMIGILLIMADQSKQRKDKEKYPENTHIPYGLYEKYIKRSMDVILSTGALIILSPVMIVIAFLVRVKLGTPVIFMQKRPGKNGKIFDNYKFRTMTDKCDENGKLLSDEIRLTTFGKKLRATSLDELPELINIIKGDMSIVGPRPLMVQYLRLRMCLRRPASATAYMEFRNIIWMQI